MREITPALLDAFQGITPIQYDPERDLVFWYVGSVNGRAVSLSPEVARIAAVLLNRAAEEGETLNPNRHAETDPEQGGKYDADCPLF